jgi:hypothetical protein
MTSEARAHLKLDPRLWRAQYVLSNKHGHSASVVARLCALTAPLTLLSPSLSSLSSLSSAILDFDFKHYSTQHASYKL